MVLTITFISDIHLEFRGDNYRNIIKASADVLCLAGDIGVCGTESGYKVLVNFLEFMSTKYKYIIHVAGNHEYYTSGEKNITKWHTMQYIDKRLKNLSNIIPNYKFLNCDTITINVNSKDYTFIGATMWTYIDKSMYTLIENSMNDYSYIYVQNKNSIEKLTVEEMQKIHLKHVKYLRKAIANTRNPTVVITHHKPVADTMNGGDPITRAYETDITNIITSNNNVCYAIHGHTHTHYDKMIKHVRFLSNPKGYLGQHTKYNGKLTVELK